MMPDRELVLVRGPARRWTDDLYEWTRNVVSDHVRSMHAGRLKRLDSDGSDPLGVDDRDIYENSVFMVTDGCLIGPWEDCTPWQQETAVAVAQRAARATLGRIRAESGGPR